MTRRGKHSPHYLVLSLQPCQVTLISCDQNSSTQSFTSKISRPQLRSHPPLLHEFHSSSSCCSSLCFSPFASFLPWNSPSQQPSQAQAGFSLLILSPAHFKAALLLLSQTPLHSNSNFHTGPLTDKVSLKVLLKVSLDDKFHPKSLS